MQSICLPRLNVSTALLESRNNPLNAGHVWQVDNLVLLQYQS